MFDRNPTIRRRAPRRPTSAAAEVVLMALADPAAPLVDPVTTAQPARLTLAGALRVERCASGLIKASRIDADGCWRRDAEAERAALLDPARLVEVARTMAVRHAMARHGGAGLEPTDRAYVEKRLAADLHPDARSTSALRAVRRALLQRVTSRAVLRSACLVFGRQATLADYNDIVRAGPATLTRLSAETPHLVPLIASLVRERARRGARRIGLGAIGSVRRHHLDAPSELRLAARDWKWLSHQPRSTVAALAQGEPGSAPTLDAAAVRLFSATGVERLPAAMVALVAPGGALQRALATVRAEQARFDDLARLTRLAVEEWRRRARSGASTRHLRDDLGYLIDWWSAEGATGALVPHNATYPSLIRRQQRWHQLVILECPEFLQQWKSAVPAHEGAGVRAVPLTDSLMLAREGIEMRHCVASYARDCAAGHTRIFALEALGSGERATLELRRRASLWFPGQIKGPCNGEVSIEMRIAAERIAARYTRAEA